MIDAYVSALPASALGAVGGSLLVVGLSLVVGVAITIVALATGALLQRALVGEPQPRTVHIVHGGQRAAPERAA